MQITNRLAGKRVVLPLADGFDPHEFWYAYYRFREEGAEVVVPTAEPGVLHSEARGFHDRPFRADTAIAAGAEYVEEPAVRDGNLITAVYFAYLPDHFRSIMDAMLS